MHYLITGGAGFIGSHLAERLLREGHTVTIVDDLSTGSLGNLAHLSGTPGLHCIIDTVANSSLLADLVEHCDAIFHLAAAVGVKLIVNSPVRTIDTNLTGTAVVLRCASRKQKKVLLASSSEVYGKTTAVPFSEADDIVLGPTSTARWSYACAKAMAEFLALAYRKETGLPVVIARLFNTVGPRQTGRYGMVVPTFVRQALRGHPITIYGDGTQSRCFTHVEDTVETLIRLAQHPHAVGEVFNVGSDEEITIEALARLVKDLTRSPSEICHIPYEQAYEAGFEDMSRRVPDLSKVRSFLGHRPPRSLHDILRDVIDYFRRAEYV
ncbi:MAG: NAD-dependent epimerase/dehydratase family protein [Thermodesulfobacteriota bacterium]